MSLIISFISFTALIHTRLFRREINAQDIPYTSSSLQSPPADPNNTSATSHPGIGQFSSIGGVGTLDRPRLDSVSSDDSNSQSSSSRRASFRTKFKFLPFLENIKLNRLIKDSNVLYSKDGTGWDWEVISTIIRVSLQGYAIKLKTQPKYSLHIGFTRFYFIKSNVEEMCSFFCGH